MFIDPTKQLLYVKQVLPHETRKGLCTLVRPDGRVHSIDANGNVDSRPANYDGGQEACQIDGALATFQPEMGKFFTFGIAHVDALL